MPTSTFLRFVPTIPAIESHKLIINIAIACSYHSSCFKLAGIDKSFYPWHSLLTKDHKVECIGKQMEKIKMVSNKTELTKQVGLTIPGQ